MRYLPQQQCYVQNRILTHGVRHHFCRGVRLLRSWTLSQRFPTVFKMIWENKTKYWVPIVFPIAT